MGNLSQNKVESALSGEKVEPTSDQLRLDEIIKLQNRIGELEKFSKEQEERIEELESELEEVQEPENMYFDEHKFNVCGEAVYIKCDNIAHQTFFEQLEEKSKKYSINQLTEFIDNL